MRASDWIVNNQEDDGSWTRANLRQMKRVYDSYVSAPLARLARITGNETYAGAAIRNCEFVLQEQRDLVGFFNGDFVLGQRFWLCRFLAGIHSDGKFQRKALCGTVA